MVAVVLGVSLLVGCSSTSASEPPTGRWGLARFTGSERAAPGAYLELADSKAVGFSGSSVFSAPYSYTPQGELTFGEIESTRTVSAPAAMVAEEAFFGMIRDSAGYTLSGDTLEILGGNGRTIATLRRVDAPSLFDTEWSLVATDDREMRQPPISSNITLRLKRSRKHVGRVTGRSGCGPYFAEYAVDGAGVVFRAVESRESTPCAVGLRMEKRRYLSGLRNVRTWAIAPAGGAGAVHVLELRDSRGDTVAIYEGHGK